MHNVMKKYSVISNYNEDIFTSYILCTNVHAYILYTCDFTTGSTVVRKRTFPVITASHVTVTWYHQTMVMSIDCHMSVAWPHILYNIFVTLT